MQRVLALGSVLNSPACLSHPQLHHHLHHLYFCIDVPSEHMASIFHQEVDELASGRRPVKDIINGSLQEQSEGQHLAV